VAGSGRKNADAALVAGLAAGLSVARAAERAGVSERTARRRLQDDAFKARVERARVGLLDKVVARLTALGATAVRTLNDLMKAGVGDNIRLGAARATLEHMFRGFDEVGLLKQVAELRQSLEELRNGDEGVGPGTGQGDPAGGGPGGAA
jgi:hypothetical protein